jgi:adenine C2-methylase RlmN of 23S rRNA A2503 and tRNA A37
MPVVGCRLVGMPAKLAWSVHAADDGLRKALVPTTHSTMVGTSQAAGQSTAQRSGVFPLTLLPYNSG